MLCFIPFIRKYAKDHSDIGNMKEVNNLTKTLFHGLSEDKMDVTQNLFCTEYSDFDNNNGSFGGEEFIRKSKEIRGGNSHLWYQKYSLPCIKVLVFVEYIVTSEVIGIGTSECS